MHGDLSRDTLGDAIRSLYVNRRSGILHLAQEKVSKRIYFRKGSMIFANSDVETDRLGEFLIRNNVIDREAFGKASEAMKETGNRFGKTVVNLGYCDAAEMEQRVVEQIQAIIYSLFDWDAGEYRFEQHENPVDEDIVLNLSTADIIIEGTRQLADIEKIRRTVGEESRVLQHTENPLLLYQKVTTLSQSEYFILSRIDGTSSISDILSVSPLGEDETYRCIYGLLSAGVLEFQGRAEASLRQPERAAPKPVERPSPATAARQPSPSPPPAPPRPVSPAAEIPKPEPEIKAPAAEPPAEPSGPSAEEIAVRDDILETHASLSEATLYDLLAITITANDVEVKKAYYAMAKKYHPDRHHSPHLRDVHGLLEELFVKITDAYQTLSSPLERNRYDVSMRSKSTGDGGGGAEDEQRSRKAGSASEAARKRSADEQFKEGKHHYDEMHFFDAIQALREAVRLYPQKSYHKLLAQALAKNPKWVKEAEEQFRLALKLDQFDADCYLGLGEIYDTAGMTTRAQKMYEQALTYDPENPAIREKLGADHSGSTLGGINKIFGRKKD